MLSNMEIRANNLRQLKDGVISAIKNGKLEDESNSILGMLLEINQLGMITTESQPNTTIRFQDYMFVQRAFLVGFYPHHLMMVFVNKLTEINPDLIIAETILAPYGDGLSLWNFKDEDYKIVDNNQYPMYVEVYYGGNVRYLTGAIGNIKKPAYRGDYMEFYSKSLVEELYAGQYSLIQIYSRNINDKLFGDVIKALIFV